MWRHFCNDTHDTHKDPLEDWGVLDAESGMRAMFWKAYCFVVSRRPHPIRGCAPHRLLRTSQHSALQASGDDTPRQKNQSLHRIELF
jgi:hypothetical protein